MTTTIPPHRRGDTFRRSVPLAEADPPWEWDEFTGGVTFTLRADIPASSTTNDEGAVDQATSVAGEITYAEETRLITVVIPASRTRSWPAKKLYWDLEVRIAGDPEEVYTIDCGDILIQPDFTRGQVDS